MDWEKIKKDYIADRVDLESEVFDFVYFFTDLTEGKIEIRLDTVVAVDEDDQKVLAEIEKDYIREFGENPDSEFWSDATFVFGRDKQRLSKYVKYATKIVQDEFRGVSEGITLPDEGSQDNIGWFPNENEFIVTKIVSIPYPPETFWEENVMWGKWTHRSQTEHKFKEELADIGRYTIEGQISLLRDIAERANFEVR